MKNLSFFIVLGGMCLSLLSCQEKPLPLPSEGEVDFYLDGQIDGQAIRLDAGKKGYYMYTRRERNINNLWIFEGQLSPVDCQECPNSFAIEFRDVDIRPDNGGFDIPSIFQPKSYPFAFAPSLGPVLFKVSYQTHASGGNNPLLQWTFGDGSTSNELNPIRFYEEISGNSYEVCLSATDGQNCESQICNEVRLDLEACKVDFVAEIDTGLNYVKFESQIQGAAPIQYNWSFGDGNSSNQADPGVIYQTKGRYKAELNIIDANGCRASYSRLVSTDPNQCTYNFDYQLEQVTSPDSMQFGHVRVLWWDENGQLYRSDWSQQDSESKIEITEVLDYQDNELGQPTLRLGLDLNCRLSNGDHEVRLENAKAFIGVALP
ncbi:MAG: PKD domain-containing protein [Bacteroidota bacterium]